MARINAKLVKGLSKEEATQFIREYEIAKKILRKIRQEVKREIESSYIKEEDLETVSPVSLAKSLGYRRGLREVLTYLPEE